MFGVDSAFDVGGATGREGDNQLDFLARDSAGNETKKLLTVNYTP